MHPVTQTITSAMPASTVTEIAPRLIKAHEYFMMRIRDTHPNQIQEAIAYPQRFMDGNTRHVFAFWHWVEQMNDEAWGKVNRRMRGLTDKDFSRQKLALYDRCRGMEVRASMSVGEAAYDFTEGNNAYSEDECSEAAIFAAKELQCEHADPVFLPMFGN